MNFGIDDGLESSTVYSLFQDSQGIIWMGTDAGVSRWAGRKVESYSVGSGLPDSDVFGFYEDRKGRIWIRTYNGLPGYFENGGIFSSGNTSWLKGWKNVIPNSMIMDIEEGKDGSIYFLPRKGWIFRVKPGETTETIQSESPTADHKFPGNGIFLDQDPSGKMWAFFRDSLICLECPTQQKIRLPSGITKGSISTGQYLNKKGRLLIYNENRLWEGKMDWNSDSIPQASFREYSLPASVNFIREDGNLNLWVGTRNGIFKFRGGDLNATPDHFLPGEAVSSMLTDYEGNYWFSTLGGGVFKSPDPDIIHYPVSAFGGFSDEVSCLAVSRDGKVLLGGEKGMVWELTEGGPSPISVSRTYCITGTVTDLEFSQEGTLWVAAANCLNRYNEKGTSSTFLNAKTVYQNDAGDLWVGKSYGAYFIRKDAWTEIEGKDGDKALPNFRQFRFTTTDIEPWQDESVILGTLGGVFVNRGDSFHLLDDRFPLLQQRVQDILVETNGNIWVGTYGNGLLYYTGDTCHHISREDGLPSDIIQSVRLDSESDIWLATQQGLTKISVESRVPFSYSIRNFTRDDGLPTLEVRDVLPLAGRILVATTRGLTQIPTSSLQGSSSEVLPGQFIINGIEFGARAGMAEISGKEALLKVIPVSFLTDQKIEVRVKIGDQPKWISSGTDEVRLSGLEPGENSLKIDLRRQGGKWLSEPIEFNLLVRKAGPLFSGWVWILIGLGLGAGIAWGAGNWGRRRENLIREEPEPATADEVQASREPFSKEYLFLKIDGVHRKIWLKDIQFIKGARNYVEIHTTEKKYLYYSSMKNIEEELNHSGNFLRVHRSYIVRIDKIEMVEGNQLHISGTSVPIGEAYRQNLEELL